MTTLCSQCGFINPPGMRFCGNCGNRLDEQNPMITPVDTPTIVSTPNISEQLGVVMGANLVERFRQAGYEATGQRRNVTVLFTDLSGYTEATRRLDNEVLYELIQNHIQLLVKQVYKYEGIVDKLTGDGLMALFGAPISYENNAERAVRAALDMQAEIDQWSYQVKQEQGVELKMRVGLHSGSVIVGGIGTNLMMNYTAIGDTVNLAHRIEESANPGTILVSEAVFRQTENIFEFEPEKELFLKGIDQPITAYRVKGFLSKPRKNRSADGLKAPMIGRENELNLLKKAVSDLIKNKKGQFILVTGEAGIGKSRLISEWVALLKKAPVNVLTGSSLTYRRSVSYWVFLELLRNWIGIHYLPDEKIGEKFSALIHEKLGSRASESLPYLEYLLSLPYTDIASAERIHRLDAGQLRKQIFLAVRDLLLAEARFQPLIIILEDLHWADEASLDLLTFLLEALKKTPFLVVAVSRPVVGTPVEKIQSWMKLNLDDRSSLIELKNLSNDQSEDLLYKLITIEDLPDSLHQQIIQNAEGVPLYLEEILHMLIDKGILQSENNVWRVASQDYLNGLDVPDNIQELILARFDRLNENSRKVLQYATVIGNHFNRSLLNYLLQPIDESDLDEALDEMIEKEFIIPSPESIPDEYVFRHMLMSEAIYQTMLKRERSLLHGKVGEALETLYPDHLYENIELLARHYSWSPQLDRALHYLILAGQKAAQGYINEQAQEHFNLALDLLPRVAHTTTQMVQINMGLGDLALLAGEYQPARQYYQSALEELDQNPYPMSDRDKSILLRKIASTLERQGEYDSAFTTLESASKYLENADNPPLFEKAQILNDIGWIQFRKGDLDAAGDFLFKALSLIENQEQFELTASVYNRLAGVYFQKDQLDQAGTYLRKSLVLRQEIGDIGGVARSFNNLGLMGWKRGDWNSALENFKRSVNLHATLGDVEGMIEVHINLGLLLLDRGDLDDARRHLSQALSRARQIGHTYYVGLISLDFARLFLASEDWQAALEYSQRSLETFREIGAQDHLVDVYTYIGLANLGMNNLEEARRWGEDALGLFRHVSTGRLPGQAEDHGRAMRLLGEVMRRIGNFPYAETLLSQSSATFQTVGNQLEQGRSMVALARLAKDKGNPASARLMVHEAQLIFEQLGAKNDLKKLESLSF